MNIMQKNSMFTLVTAICVYGQGHTDVIDPAYQRRLQDLS